MSGQIFVSYRRDDTEGYAGRLYDRLSAHFDSQDIFMDIDTIEPGADFVAEIEKAVNSCDVLLALIGPRWLSVADREGNLRLENPEDFVRIEIAAALNRGIRVIPVLLQNALMPHSPQLPENLKSLARRNAIEVSYTRFHPDVDRLIRYIESALESAAENPFAEERKEGEGEQVAQLAVEQSEESFGEVLAETVSIETLGGIATPAISRGAPIPTRYSQIFSTAVDNQSQVEIHLMRGERPMAADNESLGKFILDGILPAPRGVPQIELSLDIDANGILTVTAKDKATQREQHITVKVSDAKDQEGVARRRSEAEQHAEEDRRRVALAEAQNKIDQAIYSATSVIKNYEGREEVEEKLNDIQDKIGLARLAKKTDDVNAISKAANDLLRAQYRLTEDFENSPADTNAFWENLANDPNARRVRPDMDFSDIFEQIFKTKDDPPKKEGN